MFNILQNNFGFLVFRLQLGRWDSNEKQIKQVLWIEINLVCFISLYLGYSTFKDNIRHLTLSNRPEGHKTFWGWDYKNNSKRNDRHLQLTWSFGRNNEETGNDNFELYADEAGYKPIERVPVSIDWQEQMFKIIKEGSLPDDNGR